jgi:predicted outer membrane repeat protein
MTAKGFCTTALVIISVLFISSPALGQYSWSKYEYNPVLDVGASPAHDSKQASVCCVIKKDAEYWMYYYASPLESSNQKWIMLARSSDGVSWTKHGNGDEPLDFNISGWHEIMGISVLYDPENTPAFQAWYAVADYVNGPIDIHYATSDDGISWSPTGMVLARGTDWESHRIQEPCVVNTGNTYHMWYRGQGSGGATGIGHATSTDGINWTKDATNPVIEAGAGWPWVIELDGAYIMYARGSGGEIGYATSSDGSDWDTRELDNPVLTRGPVGAWDNISVQRLAALVDSGMVKGWYMGGDSSYLYRTGYAISCSGVTIHVPADAPSIQAAVNMAQMCDTVEVACGTYLESNIVLKSGITLRSETRMADCVTIDAQSNNRAFYCSNVDESTTIEGFTVTGGAVSGGNVYGGGILFENSTVTVKNCVFQDNSATDSGGGIGCVDSDVTFDNCDFIGNSAAGGHGGAIYTGVHCNIVSTYCVFASNSTFHHGGAVQIGNYCSGSFTNCTFLYNAGPTGGGALNLSPDTQCWVYQSIFWENSSNLGSDAYLHSGSNLEVNCCDVDTDGLEGPGSVIWDASSFSADPLFCGEVGNPDDPYTLDAASPCAESNSPCGLIGARPEGCVLEPPTGNVAGTVVCDCPSPGTGLHGATVEARDPGTGDVISSTTTDASGHYVLDDLYVGDYLIVLVVPSGYTTSDSEEPVTVTDGGTVTVDFSLSCVATAGEMVLVPGGIYLVGDGATPCGEDAFEATLTQDFYLGRYEVMNAEYMVALQWAYDNGYVTATTSSVLDNLDGSTEELLDLDDLDCEIQFDGSGTFYLREAISSDAQSAYPYGYNPANHAVKEVTWYGAARYCDWLSLQEDRPRAYEHNGDWACNGGNPYAASGYRLPTSFEWEFAAQYDDERRYPWGNDPATCALVNGEISGFCVGWTAPAGSYPYAPVELGFSDLSGSVWEWCNDWHACDLGTTPITDPIGPTSGTHRVRRGGSWYSNDYYLYSACRGPSYPNHSGSNYGFRVARTANLIGSVAGVVVADCPVPGTGLHGVQVDAYEAGSGLLVDGVATDENGYYMLDSLTVGEYVMTVVVPLGYSASADEVAVTITGGGTAAADFSLACISIASNPRSIGFWKHQVGVATGGKGRAQIDGATLCGYLDLIEVHFNSNEINPVAVYLPPASGECEDKLSVAGDLLNLKGAVAMMARAKQQLLALLLNVAGEKISLTEIISEDGATVSQAITYCDNLIDDPQGDHELAKTIADYINNGRVVPADMIPLDTDVIAYSRPAPSVAWLGYAWPNPTTGMTRISYSVPRTGAPVYLEVFDAAGRLVKRLQDGQESAGVHEVVWHGDDDNGHRVAPGVYFYQLRWEGKRTARKLIMVD